MDGLTLLHMDMLNPVLAEKVLQDWESKRLVQITLQDNVEKRSLSAGGKDVLKCTLRCPRPVCQGPSFDSIGKLTPFTEYEIIRLLEAGSWECVVVDKAPPSLLQRVSQKRLEKWQPGNKRRIFHQVEF